MSFDIFEKQLIWYMYLIQRINDDWFDAFCSKIAPCHIQLKSETLSAQFPQLFFYGLLYQVGPFE